MSSYNYMVQHGAAVIDPKTFVESDIVKQGIAVSDGGRWWWYKWW